MVFQVGYFFPVILPKLCMHFVSPEQLNLLHFITLRMYGEEYKL
jgi:hypothetical protein